MYRVFGLTRCVNLVIVYLCPYFIFANVEDVFSFFYFKPPPPNLISEECKKNQIPNDWFVIVTD